MKLLRSFGRRKPGHKIARHLPLARKPLLC